MNPGWYDDPGGDRASLRWWDGRSWTSVTRVRGPGEELPEPAAAPVEVLDSARPPVRRGPLLAGAAVLAAVVLAVLLLPGTGTEDRLADRGRTTMVPTEPVPTAAPRVTGRVVDRVARLSYDVLPGEWREWDRDSFSALRSTLGYYRVTQENAPNAQTYWANVNSGPVAPRVADPAGDLRTTARRALSVLADEYYPAHSRADLQQRRLTVDGRPAALVRYRAVFDPDAAAGYSAKSEQIVVLVVDTGELEEPSVLYVSLPDTVRDLWPSIDPLLASVRIVR